MFGAIRDNIRSFLDITIFIAMLAIGAFAIFEDYRYFRKIGYHRDAASALGIGAACMILPFILLLAAQL